jgi:hypothetical protein
MTHDAKDQLRSYTVLRIIDQTTEVISLCTEERAAAVGMNLTNVRVKYQGQKD